MKNMKSLTALMCAFTILGGFSLARAADETKTITGEGKCAKTALKADVHQTLIDVKVGDKTVTYYVVDNDVDKAFHKNICKKPQAVTATGTVKDVNDKQELTATKIELRK